MLQGPPCFFIGHVALDKAFPNHQEGFFVYALNKIERRCCWRRAWHIACGRSNSIYE